MNNSEARKDTYSEITLRRYRAGELSADERQAIANAAARDTELRLRLRALADEQSAFEAAVPFERFVGGVSRAQREQQRRLSKRAPLWAASAATMALAAAAMVVMVIAPMQQTPSTRTKGSHDAFTSHVRVASDNGEQRVAMPGKLTSLRKGDRVRVGVQLKAGATYFAAVSVEPSGATTAIYPEGNSALHIVPTKEPMYMPDSVEFTGHGDETLFILTAPQAFDVAAAADALKALPHTNDPATLERLGAKIPGLVAIPYPLRKP